MKTPELEPGATFGCWVVVRLVCLDPHGRRKYLVRASCCGNEKVRLQYSVMSSRARQCIRCGGKQRWETRRAKAQKAATAQ